MQQGMSDRGGFLQPTCKTSSGLNFQIFGVQTRCQLQANQLHRNCKRYGLYSHTSGEKSSMFLPSHIIACVYTLQVCPPAGSEKERVGALGG